MAVSLHNEQLSKVTELAIPTGGHAIKMSEMKMKQELKITQKETGCSSMPSATQFIERLRLTALNKTTTTTTTTKGAVVVALRVPVMRNEDRNSSSPSCSSSYSS